MTPGRVTVLAFLGGFLGTCLADLVSEEIRCRLDRIPALLIRIAGQRLADDIRTSTIDEWLAELDSILLHRGATPLPLTRLIIGIRYSAGLFRNTTVINQELSSRPGASPKLLIQLAGILPLLATVGVLTAGYIGFAQSSVGVPYDGHPIDIVYYELQLFIFGPSSLQEPGPLPILLEIARFTAPALSAYFVLTVIWLLRKTRLPEN